MDGLQEYLYLKECKAACLRGDETSMQWQFIVKLAGKKEHFLHEQAKKIYDSRISNPPNS